MAGRQKKRLTVAELSTAYRYVADKIDSLEWVAAGEHRRAAEGDLSAYYTQHRDALYAHGPDMDDAARADAAEALTQFLERWFSTQDWTRLKNLLRRKKADREHGAPRRIAVSDDTLRMLQRLVEADPDCDTQDAYLTKLLAPQMEQLHDQERAQDVATINQALRAMPALELAARYLVYLKRREQNGITLTKSDYADPAQHLTELLATYEAMPFQYERHDAVFQKTPGKWQGMAKRRWPELTAAGDA